MEIEMLEIVINRDCGRGSRPHELGASVGRSSSVKKATGREKLRQRRQDLPCGNGWCLSRVENYTFLVVK